MALASDTSVKDGKESPYVLGLSCFYHDAAAALLKEGEIVAAAHEERFTRKKHDARFPKNAIAYCLREAGIEDKDLRAVAFYDKPFTKFERILETHLAYAPKGLRAFLMAMPIWLKEKLWPDEEIRAALPGFVGEIVYATHHESHAASTFFASPFNDAAVLTVDGVGEWATTTIGRGERNTLTLLEELHFPHSLGLLYSAFTYYLGFKVNSGEYKVMGLAPYGEPKYSALIREHLIDAKEDGSFRLNLDYFDYPVGLKMTNAKFAKLFGVPARARESALTQEHMDIAASLQEVTEDLMFHLALRAKATAGSKNLCLAGGVALNCVANGKLLRSGEFDHIFVQPAAGDAGGALGAAYVAWYSLYGEPRTLHTPDAQKGSLLGPSYSDDEIEAWLKEGNIPYTRVTEAARPARIAELLAESNVVGVLYGRSEFGPRALGSRSILADPRDPEMQSKLNLKIKFRESFRPFAPSVLEEYAHEWFELATESPYMLLTADVRKDKRLSTEAKGRWGIEWLKVPKSEIPAVTHVDYSARVQTVDRERSPGHYAVIDAFRQKTGCPVVVNTSFNVRGEPIIETPEDAYRCFMRTDMDALALGSCILLKKEQPKTDDDETWKNDYELD
jgi:carbamoyltransferase